MEVIFTTIFNKDLEGFKRNTREKFIHTNRHEKGITYDL